MIKKQHILCAFLLLLCLSTTGCGTKLYELTDEEEDMIVLYSAKIVSKYNRSQDTGYCFVVEEEEEDNIKEDEPENELPNAGEVENNKTMSFSDIVNISGLEFTYSGYDISKEYSTEDIVIPDAAEGNDYIILKIQANNVTDQVMKVDLLSNPIRYTLNINNSVNVDCTTTLSMDDLSTYYNASFSAQSSDDVVLIFQTKTEYLENINSLTLQVQKDGQTFNVILL